MNATLLGLAVITPLALLAPGFATAIVGTATHPYDDLAAWGPVGTQYAGFSYSTGATVSCSSPWGFPGSPESPHCKFFDAFGTTTITAGRTTITAGATTITTSTPLHYFGAVRGWCATAAPFANPNGITIDIIDLARGVARTTCKSDYGWTSPFRLRGTGLPADTLVIRGTPYYWTADHLVFSSFV